jgi:hypothetical protein
MTNNDPDSWKLAYAEKNGAVDPELTELGKAQATVSLGDANIFMYSLLMASFSTQAVGSAWKDMLERGIPKPEKYLVSPLVRAIDTMNLTYGDLMEDDQKPVVVEASCDLSIPRHVRDMSLTYQAFIEPPRNRLRKYLGSTPHEGE